MTTPTREQVIELSQGYPDPRAIADLIDSSPGAAMLTEGLSQKGLATLMCIALNAWKAGRAQGLGEAVEVCKAERAEFIEQSARNDGRQSDMAFGSVNSAERIAAAIEQLKGKQ